MPHWEEEVCQALSPQVYVTIDLDVLDPAIMPAVGTPEPGGLDWRALTGLLRRVAQEKTVVGFDVVELTPIPGIDRPGLSGGQIDLPISGGDLPFFPFPGKRFLAEKEILNWKPWSPENFSLPKGSAFTRKNSALLSWPLRDAGIEKCNLVHVSSILPPRCKIISRTQGLRELVPGGITFCVLARCSTNEPRRLIAASIGCAIPSDRNLYGYLSEHHAFGQTEKEAGDYAEDLAAAMLASTLGIEFDEDKSWDEKKEFYRISDKIVRTTNITQSSIVKTGWSTVVAAAVFLLVEKPGKARPDEGRVLLQLKKAGRRIGSPRISTPNGMTRRPSRRCAPLWPAT